MDEYEWSAQWRDDTDSWLRYNGWMGEWETEDYARRRYDELSKLQPPFDGTRLVKRRKAGPVEVISE